MGKTLSIRLDEDTYKILEDVAEKEGITKSAVIKRALKVYFKLRKRRRGIDEILDEIEKLREGYIELRNRVNVLSTQIEKILGRLANEQRGSVRR